MSHFTTIKTKCTDQDLLVKSIQQIGYVAKIGKFNCRGYQGNKTTVDILISLKGGYDIGFVYKDNNYEMVADWWGINEIDETEFVQSLNQQYSIFSTTQELQNKGFSLDQETLSNGTVRLVARKLG